MTLTLLETLEIRPDGASALGSTTERRGRRSLERMARLSQRPPCFVVLGESNAGKTTLANRLLGAGLLPASVLANTRYPTLVRHGAVPGIWSVAITGRRAPLSAPRDLAGQPIAMIEITLPHPRLVGMEVLDAPAGMALDTIAALPGLSRLLVPVWCTPATQAWKESERRAWSGTSAHRRRRAILAVTGLDRIEATGERARLVRRLQAEAAPLFATVAYAPDAPEGQIGLTVASEAVAADLNWRRNAAVTWLSRRLATQAGDRAVLARARDAAV